MEVDLTLPKQCLVALGSVWGAFNIWHVFREVRLCTQAVPIEPIEVNSQLVGILGSQRGDAIFQCNSYEQRNLLSQISPGVGLSHYPRGIGTASRCHMLAPLLPYGIVSEPYSYCQRNQRRQYESWLLIAFAITRSGFQQFNTFSSLHRCSAAPFH